MRKSAFWCSMAVGRIAITPTPPLACSTSSLSLSSFSFLSLQAESKQQTEGGTQKPRFVCPERAWNWRILPAPTVSPRTQLNFSLRLRESSSSTLRTMRSKPASHPRSRRRRRHNWFGFCHRNNKLCARSGGVNGRQCRNWRPRRGTSRRSRDQALTCTGLPRARKRRRRDS